MRIYFVGSIKGKSKYFENYKEIVRTLKNLGFEVLENTLIPTEDYVSSFSDEEKIKQYKDVLKRINSSDVVVVEASFPSLGVGFEISLAMEKGKPVVALYTEEYVPHLIQGIESEKLFLVKYNLSNLKTILKRVIEDTREQRDTRFTLLLPPKIVDFLNQISKKKKIPRSVFIRSLIEREIRKGT